MPMDYGRKQGVVVAIECVAGGSRAEEWGPGCSETVQTGDVVEELLIGVGGRGGAIAHAAPFKGGRSALQKLLHAAYKRGDTSVEVRVRRPAQTQQLEMDSSGELVSPGSEASVETTTTITRMQACIVPQEAATGGGGGIVGMGMVGRSSRQYVLRSIRDPNYAVGLVDRMESECVAFREQSRTKEKITDWSLWTSMPPTTTKTYRGAPPQLLPSGLGSEEVPPRTGSLQNSAPKSLHPAPPSPSTCSTRTAPPSSTGPAPLLLGHRRGKPRTAAPRICGRGGRRSATKLREAPPPERTTAAPKRHSDPAANSTTAPAGHQRNPTLFTGEILGSPPPPAAGAADGEGGNRRIVGGEVDRPAGFTNRSFHCSWRG